MITPFILLNNNKIQNYIAKGLTSYFERKTNAKLEVGHISLKYFNEITIDSIYLEDLNKRKLAAIENIDAKIKLLPLLRGEINVKEITIHNLNANLHKDTTGITNFQFLIDALIPKEKLKSPDVKIPLITLDNASISYIDHTNSDCNNKKNEFNPKDIYIYNLNTQIQFRLENQSNINASIYYLNLKEKSGFKISNIQANTSITDSTIVVPYLNLDLPKTKLNLDSIYAKIYKKDKGIDWASTEINFNITNSQLRPSDLGAIIPELANLRETAFISSQVKGTLSKIKANTLKIKYGKSISIDMNLTADSIYDINQSKFLCDINHIRFDKSSIQDIIANIQNRPFILPDELNNLGLCQYSGKITGKATDLNLLGNLNSNIGRIQTDFNLRITNKFNTFNVNGKIGSKKLELGILSPSSGLGNISFNSNSNILVNTNKEFKADTKVNIEEFTYQDYSYKNILIDGNLTPSYFSGKFRLDDPNGYLDFNGFISHTKGFNKFEFTANVDKLNLNKLNIISSLPNLTISLSTNSNFSGNQISNMNGYMNLDSIFLKNGNKEFYLDNLCLTAKNDSISFANITSDIINGEITGEYKIASLKDNILYTLSKSMPIVRLMDWKMPTHINNLSCLIEIEPLKPLLETLDMNWYTTEKSTIYASYNSKNDIINANINIPQIANAKTSVDSIMLTLDNFKGIHSKIALQKQLKNGRLNASLNLLADKDTISSTLSWDNMSNKLFAGEIITETALLTDEKDSITTNTTVLPTEIIVLNKSWTVKKSNIWSNLQKVIVDDFKIKSEDKQLISINGIASKNNNEKLDIILDNISLDYIDQLLPEETEISFGGIVSGNASIANAFTLPEINAHVNSNKFYFDGSYFGNAIANCEFDHNTTSLKFDGIVINDNSDTTAVLSGNYFIPIDSLDLKGNAYGLDIAFIDYYIEDVFGKVTGQGWGSVHVHGITKAKTVAVDVDALAKNASVYVDFLKTRFYLTDSIHVDKNIIDFGQIDITDVTGNTGYVEGKIEHEYFRNIKLDLAINVNDMLVMDTQRKDSESFYGKVFGSGNVIIQGDEEEIKITCKAKTEKGTKVVIPIDNYYASENSFIIFQNTKEIEGGKDSKKEEENSEAQTNVILDLMLDITPDAEAKLIINSKSGDMLKGNGNGNLRVTYDDKAGDINIYGTYQIEQGSYLFTFQNALRKEFYIKEGSSIAWTGDPLNANVNIDAYYQLTADLAEVLDEAILSNTSRTSVPVQCLLNLSGILTQPNIKFDINLPNSEEELNRALKNTINTEEQINRQIIGLLILGKFISPETMQNTVISQNELYSVVSSTLSSQLNNWASQMFNNWGFGVNFRTSGEGETRSNEYEFNFVYTPTSRIMINGNVGYRDDALSATNFIGDFDIEYKLIQSGKLRAKAYTHTNDYREFKKGLTTQGVGLVYSESFNSLKELWQSWKDNIRKNREENLIKREQRKQRKAERKLRKEQKKAESSKNNSKN